MDVKKNKKYKIELDEIEYDALLFILKAAERNLYKGTISHNETLQFIEKMEESK